MARADEMAKQFRGSIIGRLGPEAEKTIFKTKEPPKNSIKRAVWVKEAIENLDHTVDENTRTEIMRGNGINCASHNSRVVSAALARRAEHRTLESFLESEIRKPPSGTRLERDGESLVLSYLPRMFSHPMRCFCGLVSSLPEDETLSSTYCQCSVAFVETWWSQVIGEPVSVQLIESALSGSDKCRFRLTW